MLVFFSFLVVQVFLLHNILLASVRRFFTRDVYCSRISILIDVFVFGLRFQDFGRWLLVGRENLAYFVLGAH